MDVAKAFDTVPPEAIRESLKRLKLPNQFVQLILGLEANRTVMIESYYGYTAAFTV
ncbi:hypothetical protein O9G_006393 [Rozella allomycis CSF55]|uniref:Reverse transcriptase domain-containing protein n=1 Tax=Rozella allomycis (strain CSF55) TaxID=988480 RepID=A0A075B4D6_ROZAC|nr:hypothetical protein O9G_006393 [Rozella allomycis CSF55]|eukprot:EPZ36072.1 hypothetical protein O9G_006393 [Rozella allomycis CSF55]